MIMARKLDMSNYGHALVVKKQLYIVQVVTVYTTINSELESKLKKNAYSWSEMIGPFCIKKIEIDAKMKSA